MLPPVAASAALALVVVLLGNLLTQHFENPYRRWAAKSRWNPWKSASLFVAASMLATFIASYAGGNHDHPEMRAPSGAESTTTPLVRTARPLTFAEMLATDQARVEFLRTGMTEEELVGRFGAPTGRYRAPANPYGVTVELVFRDPISILQVLLNGANAVDYFAVTATDYAFKVRTPFSAKDQAGHPTGQFVLNDSDIGQFIDSNGSSLFGDLGASWMNFGIVQGGSHAENWQHRIVGLHGLGDMTIGNVRETGSGHRQLDLLWSALHSSAGASSSTTISEADRLSRCVNDEVSRITSNDSPSEKARWAGVACNSYKTLSTQRQTQIRTSASWQEYVKAGTADTFAVTSPKLFFDYPAEVFYGIWDFGPKQEAVPAASVPTTVA